MALKAFGLAMPPQLATCEEKKCEGMMQVLEEGIDVRDQWLKSELK